MQAFGVDQKNLAGHVHTAQTPARPQSERDDRDARDYREDDDHHRPHSRARVYHPRMAYSEWD